MRVTTQLKDIVSFSKGEQIKGSDLLEEGLYDYLNGGITPSGKWNRYNTPENTVTVSEGGNSCGYVNYMDRPFWCGAHCYYLFNAKLDNKYLYYALKSQQNRLMNIRSGACMPNIKKSDLGAFKLTYETNELEQKEIVKRLDKVKLVIDLRKAELQQLDELVKSRFVEMFGDVTLNPNGYPVKKFESISTLITDGEHATPRRTTKGIYLLSARNILNHKLQLSDVDYIDEEEYNRIARRVVPQAGDILVSCSGSIGRCCVVPSGLRFQMVRSTALIRFYDTINPIFAEWLITSDELQRQIMQAATQSSQANLFQGKIRKLYGFIPPIDLQNDFAEFVKQVDKSKFCVTNHLKKIQLIKGELL